MAGLGNCRVCGAVASVVYPLLPGSPAFCGGHHNPKDAGPFGADFTGPDDFDIPGGEAFLFRGVDFNDWLEMGRFKALREKFVWTDREGDKHPLVEIDDTYLQNIINYLKRKKEVLPEFEYAPKQGVVDTEREDYRLSLLIEFFEKEQQYRGKGQVNVV